MDRKEELNKLLFCEEKKDNDIVIPNDKRSLSIVEDIIKEYSAWFNTFRCAVVNDGGWYIIVAL